jgi:hypothetical protein
MSFSVLYQFNWILGSSGLLDAGYDPDPSGSIYNPLSDFWNGDRYGRTTPYESQLTHLLFSCTPTSQSYVEVTVRHRNEFQLEIFNTALSRISILSDTNKTGEEVIEVDTVNNTVVTRRWWQLASPVEIASFIFAVDDYDYTNNAIIEIQGFELSTPLYDMPSSGDVIHPHNWIGEWSGRFDIPPYADTERAPDQTLSAIWSGSKYGERTTNTPLGAVIFRCPPTEQSLLDITMVLDGGIDILIFDAELNQTKLAGTNGIIPTAEEVVESTPYLKKRFLWVFDTPQVISAIIVQPFNNYWDQHEIWEINAFSLSNPVASIESPFWRNFKGQRELIL